MGKNHVIASASSTHNSADANYSVSHLETSAVCGLKYFRGIILGYEITVHTDHVAATELFTGNNLTRQRAR